MGGIIFAKSPIWNFSPQIIQSMFLILFYFSDLYRPLHYFSSFSISVALGEQGKNFPHIPNLFKMQLFLIYHCYFMEQEEYQPAKAVKRQFF